MHLSINPIEAIWVLLNFSTLILSISAFFDARADQAAVRRLNGQAREIAVAGIVRREGFRLLIQTLLLAIIVPALFTEGDVKVSVALVVIMVIPVLLLLSSLFDARDRKAMTILVAADAIAAAAKVASARHPDDVAAEPSGIAGPLPTGDET